MNIGDHCSACGERVLAEGTIDPGAPERFVEFIRKLKLVHYCNHSPSVRPITSVALVDIERKHNR